MLTRGDIRDIQNACAVGMQQAAPALAQAMELALVQEMLRRQTTLVEQLARATDRAEAAQRLVQLGQEAQEPHLVALEALATDGGVWCSGGQDHLLGQAVATIRTLRARLLAQVAPLLRVTPVLDAPAGAEGGYPVMVELVAGTAQEPADATPLATRLPNIADAIDNLHAGRPATAPVADHGVAAGATPAPRPVPGAPVVDAPAERALAAADDDARWSVQRLQLLEAKYATLKPHDLLRELNYRIGPKLNWHQVKARAARMGLFRGDGQTADAPRPPRDGTDDTAALKRQARELFASGLDARTVDREIECGLNAAAAWLAEWRAEQAAARARRAAA